MNTANIGSTGNSGSSAGTVGSVDTELRLQGLWSDCLPGGWSLYARKPLEIRLTKTPNGSPGLEFLFKTEPDVAPSSSNGFTCEVLAQEGVHVVRIVRTNAVLPGLFEAFAHDLIELCRSMQGDADEKAPVDCSPVIERIAAWQEFMRLRHEGLSKKEEVGLFGELSVLLDWLRAGGNPQKIADVWTGPQHGARDFRFDDENALEVKSSVNVTPFCATIESLEQLDTSEYPELRLAAVCLEEVDDVERIEEEANPTASTERAAREESAERADDATLDPDRPETIATLCEAICAHLPTELLRRRFESLALRAGFRPDGGKRPWRRFLRRKVFCYRAADLPRLTPGETPGIVRARYDILLSGPHGEALPSVPHLELAVFLKQTLRN